MLRPKPSSPPSPLSPSQHPASTPSIHIQHPASAPHPASALSTWHPAPSTQHACLAVTSQASQCVAM
eukprot:356064-Chlamydomonas_euryale.AAC.14